MKISWIKTSKKNDTVIHEVGEASAHQQSTQWNKIVKIYPEVTAQRFQAFGGALTEAAAYTYCKMSDTDKQRVLNSYFGEDDMNYRVVRVPIDSCDFSIEHYEASSDPADKNFEHLDFSRPFRYIGPLLEDAERIAHHELKLLLSPWSPPAFMKTNGERNHGGQLKAEYYGRYAAYLCKYIQEFEKRGHYVERLTIQNEPAAAQPWDSCIFEAEDEKRFIHDFLYPLLKAEGLEHVEIFFWDHNKDAIIERTKGTLDASTENEIAGLAFHWYSGDHFEQLRYFKAQYPDKKLLLTEFCVAPENPLQSAESYAHEIIGDLNAGTEAIYDWNILLDQMGGPNHVQNYCEAPFMYDLEQEQLTRNPSADYLWHFAHFIHPEAVRIAFSQYTEAIEMTAFKNVDESVVAVFLNQTDQHYPMEVQVGTEIFDVTLGPKSIMSIELV